MRLVGAALVVVALLVAAGLVLSRSSEEDEFGGEAPTGFTTYRTSVGGQDVSFAYPRSWGKVKRGKDRTASTFEASGEASKEDTRPFIQARVLPDSDPSFESTFEVNKQQTRLSGGPSTEIAEETDIDLPGADEARLVEFRFDTPTKKGSGTEPARLLAVFAKAGNVFVTFGAGAPESTGVDPRPIVETLRLED